MMIGIGKSFGGGLKSWSINYLFWGDDYSFCRQLTLCLVYQSALIASSNAFASSFALDSATRCFSLSDWTFALKPEATVTMHRMVSSPLERTIENWSVSPFPVFPFLFLGFCHFRNASLN
ncbi:MAG: hypothetical protein AAGJ51_09555 [Pseudomonadota bacterium]